MNPYVKGYDKPEYVSAKISDAEVIVGIPSRNTAHTIGYVLYNVVEGFNKYLSEKKYAIIVCDGLSDDGTLGVVRALRKKLEENILLVPNVRAPGKGAAIRTIIELMAKYSSADVLVLFDSDLRSITPEWTALMIKGIERCGYVTPYYIRHKYDATITNFIARPLTTLAYGIDIKQPIGGDFGLNRQLVETLARNPLWTSNPWIQLFGVDIFLTHTALARNIDVCEAFLGVKIHEAKDPALSLKNMFIEVTGSLYTVLIEYDNVWTNRRLEEIKTPILIDEPRPPKMSPVEIQVNPNRALIELHKSLKENRDFYETIFSDELVGKLYSREIHENGVDAFTWLEVLIEAYKAFRRTPQHYIREKILESMFGLWQGRLYRYYGETENEDTWKALQRIDEYIKAYYERRDALF